MENGEARQVELMLRIVLLVPMDCKIDLLFFHLYILVYARMDLRNSAELDTTAHLGHNQPVQSENTSHYHVKQVVLTARIVLMDFIAMLLA